MPYKDKEQGREWRRAYMRKRRQEALFRAQDARIKARWWQERGRERQQERRSEERSQALFSVREEVSGE